MSFPCHNCGGSKVDPKNPENNCPRCGGEGIDPEDDGDYRYYDSIRNNTSEDGKSDSG